MAENRTSNDRRAPDRPFSGEPSEHADNELRSTIAARLERTRSSIVHNTKRATTFSIFGVAFAGCGSALIINRVVDGAEAASVLAPTVIIALLLGAAFVIVAVEFSAWWFRDTYNPKSSHWDWLNVLTLCLAISGGALFVAYWRWPGSVGSFRFGHGSIGTALGSVALGFLMITLYYARKTHRDEQDAADLEFEQDLLRHEVKPYQNRAEKLLSVNQIQLRRYSELILQQARAVFVVGISCIGAGIAVVGLTFWLVRWVIHQKLAADLTLYTELVVGIVGAVAAVLTNYVAHMYLKLHGSITNSLMAFHNQLATTHDLFFANILASSIQDDKSREETLRQLTLAVVVRRSDGGKAVESEDKDGRASAA